MLSLTCSCGVTLVFPAPLPGHEHHLLCPECVNEIVVSIV